MNSKRNNAKSLSRTGAKILQLLFVLIFTFSLVGVQPVKPVQAADTCVTSRISASTDDVEERADNGAIDVDGDTSTKSLQTFRTYAGGTTGTLNWWGLRFLNVNVPQGATITSAGITFRSNLTSGSAASAMTLWGQLAANPTTFSTTANNVTSRTRTTVSSSWDIPQWTAATDYITPNLATLVQEIVNQAGWVANNAMVIIGQTTVSQNRSARSWNSTTNGDANAPLLTVCYSVGPSIITTGTLTAFSTPIGTPSVAQSYTVSGTNLTDPIVVTPPDGFVISLAQGAGFSADPINLVPDGDTVSATLVWVRLSGAEGSFTGNITHTSTGATQNDVAVSGAAVTYFTLSVGSDGHGDVDLSPSGAYYPVGTNVTLTAAPYTGYAFSHWDGDLTSSDNPATITMDSDKTVTANFEVSLCTTVNLSTTGDTRIRSSQATTNYGAETTVIQSPYSTSPQGGLYKWDVSGIPAGATVDSASISFYVTEASARQFSLYELRREWGESTATWNSTGTTNWSTAGAASTTNDRYNTNLWSDGFTTAGNVTKELNTDGIAVIQAWLNGSKSNYGLTVQNYSGSDQDYWTVASKENTSSYTKPTLNLTYCVSTDPTITTSGTLAAFASLPNVASESQSYTVSARNLTNDLLITAPTGYQLSLTSGGTYSSTLTLTPTDGTVSTTTIHVRLLSANTGIFGGNITHASGAAPQKNVAVTGEVSNQICYENVQIVASEDTYMSSYNTTYNYGGVDPFKVTNNNGGNSRGALLKWNLDILPDNAVVSSASLKLYVSTASTQAYNLYGMRRAWVEGTTNPGAASTTSANWTSDGTSAWGTAGASNTTSDRFDTNLWSTTTSTFTPAGSKTIPLNSDGVSVVQEWITAPANNFGVTMQSYSTTSGSDDLQISSSENTTAANRPTLLINYCVGNVVTHTLTVGNNGHGTVNLNPSGNTYAENTVVTLTPVPNSGYQFSEWTGTNASNIVNTAGVYTIVMNGDKSIFANFSQPPNAPTLDLPADNATDVSLSPLLRVNVSDPDNDTMSVSFYGRPVSTVTPAEDFMIIAIPDTQNLATSYATTMSNQFQWIADRFVANATNPVDLKFVTNLGDIVNSASSTTEWGNADAAYDKLDAAGVPYSVGPGNHDLGGLYNTNFGPSRFTGNGYYQGSYASGANENNYSFFSASGMDFIVINLQYSPGSEALNWADALLKTHSNRRAIVAQHDILNINNSWVNQASYTALSDNPNLFLMLCGHMHSGSDGSAYRLETRTEMNPVHIVQTDYQDMISGVYTDYLRLLTFKPSADQIYAQVFSPNVPGGNLTSATNYEQFNMTYDMVGTTAAPFELIGSVNGIASGSQASFTWAGRTASTEYEWYAVANDGSLSTDSSVWNFTTGTGTVNQAPVVSDIPGQTISEGATFATITLDNYVVDPDNTDAEMIWTYSGNTSLTVSIINRVATISIPSTEWNGGETITFRATDPGALYGEDSATFTVTAVNDPPVVSDIPDQTIAEGSSFATISLDDYVTDPDDSDAEMVWSSTGASQLTVSIVNRVATISIPSSEWNGGETITFRATDPGSLHDEDSASFTITAVNDAPVITGQAQVLSVPQDTSLTIELAHLSVTDVDNVYPTDFSLTVLSGTNYTVAGATITPTAGFYGELTVPVKVNDGQADSNTFNLLVTVTQGGVTPVLPSSFWGLLHFAPGDSLKPNEGDILYAYLNSETTAITSVSIGSNGTDLTYAINVPAYPNGTHPTTVKFTVGGRVLGIANWTTGTNVEFNLHPPLPDAGGPYVGLVSAGSVVLSGTVSDLGNDVNTTNWDLDNDGSFDDSAVLTPTFNFTSAGTYPVSLKAVDLQGGEGIDSSQVFAITLSGLTDQVYNGSPHPVTVTGVSSPFSYIVLYDGSPTAPTNSGTYPVQIRFLSGPDVIAIYGTSLVIGKATATVSLGSLSQTYDGATKAASATTTPAGLTVNFVYDPANPVNAGSYAVTATVSDTNYSGTASGTLVIGKATATVTLGSLSQTYNGTAKAATATTAPTGLTVNFVYDPANPVNAGSYAVTATIVDSNYQGTASGTLVIGKATATVTLGSLSQTYDGTAKVATATTAPTGLTVNFVYDPANPVNAGSYAVTATVSDTNYSGTASGTLVIGKATATVTLGSLSQTYDGATKAASATTTPAGLTVNFVYDPANPVNAGNYAVTATVSDTNYSGTASGTLVIGKATATVTLSNLQQQFDGNPKSVTVTTDPSGLTVVVTYDGSTTPPSASGSYAVVATVNDANYSGSASGTLVISGLSYSIDLVAGWNLVSFNLIPTSTAPVDIFASITGKYDLVYAWDASVATSNWLRYDPTVGFGNTLTNLDEAMGFWIYMNEAATLTLTGTVPTSTTIQLYSGWNLIGYPSQTAASLPAALEELAGNYDLIVAYHAADLADPWKLFDPDAPAFANDLESLQPGWGYWLKVVVDDTLTINY